MAPGRRSPSPPPRGSGLPADLVSSAAPPPAGQSVSVEESIGSVARTEGVAKRCEEAIANSTVPHLDPDGRVREAPAGGRGGSAGREFHVCLVQVQIGAKMEVASEISG